MSVTAFETIRQALIAALAASPVLGPSMVTSGAKRQATNDMRKQVDVQLADAAGSYLLAGAGAPCEWQTDLVIQVKVRNAAGDEPDADLDALVQAVSEQLATLTPAALGATSIDLTPRWRWRLQEGTPPYAVAQRLVRVTHETVGAALAPRP